MVCPSSKRPAHLGFTKNRASTFVRPEMATDRPSDLARLVAIAKPNVGVLTAMGRNTQIFGTVEGVAREEGTIVRCLVQRMRRS